MKNYEKDFYNFYNKPFTYIYVEEQAYKHENTKQILGKFPEARIITIKHYKDVFNRKNQNPVMQKNAPSLILAVQNETFIYPGAPVCQSFGNEHFYYASLIMNCIFDCEYCYLQGMYPSGHPVIFVNIEACFLKLSELLKEHPIYLCISFDTDLLAFENITGYVKKWIDYCKEHPTLTIEIRTKSANFKAITDLDIPNNVIIAWTLTPDYVISNFEHKTPTLAKRIEAAGQALDKGCNVRLCFDPVLFLPDYETVYADFFRNLFDKLNPDKIKDVSFGEFRVSWDYLKRMRKFRPESLVLQYPYDTGSGVAGYDKKRSEALINFFKEQLSPYLPDDKIYLWKGIDDNA